MQCSRIARSVFGVPQPDLGLTLTRFADVCTREDTDVATTRHYPMSLPTDQIMPRRYATRIFYMDPLGTTGCARSRGIPVRASLSSRPCAGLPTNDRRVIDNGTAIRARLRGPLSTTVIGELWASARRALEFRLWAEKIEQRDRHHGDVARRTTTRTRRSSSICRGCRGAPQSATET